jgi:hypothetical protein
MSVKRIYRGRPGRYPWRSVTAVKMPQTKESTPGVVMEAVGPIHSIHSTNLINSVSKKNEGM